MDHYNRLQRAINFIEENLDNAISLTDVSKAAFSSLSYFHRIFYFMTGLTVKEYIRKRRLSKAAYHLHCTALSITQIAFNAGFDSPEAFSRAFKKHFGVNPSAFRQANQEHTLFEKLNILKQYAMAPLPQLDFDLNLEYVLYKSKNVLGFQMTTTLEAGQQAHDISQFATQIMADNVLAKYFELSKTPIFGIYTNMTNENEFNYTIGCSQDACIERSNNLVLHTIPTSPYAKFILTNMERIIEAWQYIYGHWFPKNDKYRAPGFDFEIYHRDSVDIYIPMHAIP